MRISSSAVKKLKNLVRKEVWGLMLSISRLVAVFVTNGARQFFVVCFPLQGCSSSKYAPSYYHVMSKNSPVPGCKKTNPKCNENTKMPAAPVDASTPCCQGKSYSDFFEEDAEVTPTSSVLVTYQVSVIPGPSYQRHYIF